MRGGKDPSGRGGGPYDHRPRRGEGSGKSDPFPGGSRGGGVSIPGGKKKGRRGKREVVETADKEDRGGWRQISTSSAEHPHLGVFIDKLAMLHARREPQVVLVQL